MEDFLIHYGLLAVFVGAIVEGDGVALLAGVIAHLGFFSLQAGITATALGAVTVDWLCYGVGRSGAAAIRESALYRRVGPSIEDLAGRVGAWEVTAARFVPGARVGSMLFWGMRGLAFGRFAALDLLGCAAWSSLFVALGFAFSGSAAMLIVRVKRTERLLVAAVVFGGLLWLRRRWMGARKRPPQASTQADKP
ncbi:MAG TPA: DedA family protein [Candidatus Kryptonia bacterium]|nr:DedA family protein [Candidatus Kryptonia bacterium]